MTVRPGAVVRCGRTLPLSRTFDGLMRQVERLDDVTLVLAPDADARVTNWLIAMSARRGWKVIRATGATPGAAFNAGLAASAAEWVFLLEGGDVLARDASVHVAAALEGADDPALVAGGVRLVALGVDEIVPAGDPGRPETFDPAHPGLRACCWHRDTVIRSGGLDASLDAALRYDLWLRLLASGRRGTSARGVLLTIGVDDAAFVDELNGPGYQAATAAVLQRHLPLLASRLGDVLEARAGRVTTLGARHAAALAREAEAAGTRREDGLPPPPAAPGAGGGVLPRRVTPRSRDWGYERGGPLDRVYIEQFLERHAADVRGAVLEVQEPDYSRRFGAAVTSSDVVDLSGDNPQATIVSDLRTADNIPSESYDCVIVTQTVHVIDDMPAVIAQCWRLLRPGGVLLATFPCVSRVCLEYGRDGDFWRLTPAGARRLVEPAFGEGVGVDVFGNVLASSAFLMGMSPIELRPEELAFVDDYNPTLVGVRAVKARETERPGAPALRTGRADEGLVLLYHRVADEGPDPHRLTMPAAAFEQQVAWLAGHCAAMPLNELIAGARRRSLPPRAVAITFDDGYVDTCERALPVLQRYAVAATCFVATADLDADHVFWWDRLAALLLGAGPRPESLRLVLPGGPRVLATASEGERVHAHFVAYHAVSAQSPEVRDGVIDQLRRWAGDARPPQECRRMTAAELRAGASGGLTLGAHTVNHLQLPRQPRDIQASEIAASRETLERIAGRPVRAFAYPFGACDDGSVQAAREAGMECAFTCEARPLGRRDDLLRLPRVEIQERQLEQFAARVGRMLESRA